MVVKREIPPEWLKLMHAGFVHVTGLPTFEGHDQKEKYIIFPYHDKRPAAGGNNSMCVVYLPDGSVWLRCGHVNTQAFVQCSFGAGVPCSNGEEISSYHLMRRIADPFWHAEQATTYEKEDPYTAVLLGYVNCPATWEQVQLHHGFMRHRAECEAREVAKI